MQLILIRASIKAIRRRRPRLGSTLSHRLRPTGRLITRHHARPLALPLVRLPWPPDGRWGRPADRLLRQDGIKDVLTACLPSLSQFGMSARTTTAAAAGVAAAAAEAAAEVAAEATATVTALMATVAVTAAEEAAAVVQH